MLSKLRPILGSALSPILFCGQLLQGPFSRLWAHCVETTSQDADLAMNGNGLSKVLPGGSWSGVTVLWSFLRAGLCSRCCRWQVRSQTPWSWRCWSLVGSQFAGIGMELLFHIWARVLERLKWTAHIFQLWSRVRCRKTYRALSFSKHTLLDRTFSSILSRSQASPAVTILGRLQRQSRIPADVFGWRVYLMMRFWRMRFWRLWQPGSGLLALLAKPGSALWDTLGRQTRTGWISCHFSNNANAVFAAPEQGTHLASADQQKHALVHRLDLCSRHIWHWHCPV